MDRPIAAALPPYTFATEPNSSGLGSSSPGFGSAEVNESSDLPAYTATRRPGSLVPSASTLGTVEHKYFLANSKDRRWFTLKVRSSARSSTSLPVFYEGQPISGCVDLDLDKVDTIQAVIVTVTGKVIASGVDSKQFYSSSLTLWNTSMGDPRSPGSGQVKHSGKLQGQYTWPFSFTLPKDINLNSRQARDLGLPRLTQTLPPTFSEKGGFSLLNYELQITIKRNGIFSFDSTLGTVFGYTSRSRPPPASPLRQLAYQEGTPLLGPDIDPAGWSVFPAVNMEGKLFHALKVSINCSLALATPLSYPRGSVIPCILNLESNDAQALDLLSNPSNPVVQLHRKINTRVGVDNVGATLTDATRDSHLALSTARWWPPESRTAVCQEAGTVAYKRTLIGEISLPRDLKPSFSFGAFMVKYHVEMYPFEAAGFAPTKDGRIFRTDVEITTDFPPGPRPRSYLPPGYDGCPSTEETTGLEESRVLQRSGFV